MYLLLSRHLQIFAVCRTIAVDDNELWDAGRSMERVFAAVNIRHDELQGIQRSTNLASITLSADHLRAALFIQQHLEPSQKFKSFACELVSTKCFPSEIVLE